MSVSIISTQEDGRVGRLNLFETGEVTDWKIQRMADRWREHFGPNIKISVVKTNDTKSRPNF